jgi:hypothetical protein
MELMIMHDDLIQPYTELATVNSGELAEQVSKLPEDYVFILTIKEFKDWLKLHQEMLAILRSLKSSEEKWGRMTQFAIENHLNLTSVISVISIYPSIGASYKISALTENALKDCCAVFFVKINQEEGRAKYVQRKVLAFKADQARKPPLS